MSEPVSNVSLSPAYLGTWAGRGGGLFVSLRCSSRSSCWPPGRAAGRLRALPRSSPGLRLHSKYLPVHRPAGVLLWRTPAWLAGGLLCSPSEAGECWRWGGSCGCAGAGDGWLDSSRSLWWSKQKRSHPPSRLNGLSALGSRCCQCHPAVKTERCEIRKLRNGSRESKESYSTVSYSELLLMCGRFSMYRQKPLWLLGNLPGTGEISTVTVTWLQVSSTGVELENKRTTKIFILKSLFRILLC